MLAASVGREKRQRAADYARSAQDEEKAPRHEEAARSAQDDQKAPRHGGSECALSAAARARPHLPLAHVLLDSARALGVAPILCVHQRRLAKVDSKWTKWT